MGKYREHELRVTTRDKVLRAWQNSMELVRDFENYSHDIEDDKQAAQIFADFAVQESEHAAKFLDMLHEYQENGIV